MAFSKTTSAEANKKKRKRYPREGDSDSKAQRLFKKRKDASAEKKRVVNVTCNKILSFWRKNLLSGGSNNAITHAGAVNIINALTKYGARLTKRSSKLLDIGSGCGLPCIYVAPRYDVPCIGIEKDKDLVSLAKTYADEAGVSELCTFLHQDATHIAPRWLAKQGISHVLSFDARFGEPVLRKLYENVLGRANQGVVGCSPIQTQKYWPESFARLRKIKAPVRMSGTSQSFTFAMWTQENKV